MKDNLILLHGALGTKQQLQKLNALLSQQFNIYTLDFEGHGKTTSSSEFSINLFTKNVKDFIDQQGLTKVNIFGYSMGGYVGINLAMKHPHLVDSIMTFGTKFNWSIDSAEKEIKMLDPSLIQEKVPGFAKHLQIIHGENNWNVVLNKTAAMMMNLSKGDKMNHEDLSQIKHNILIGIGSLDKTVSIQESQDAVNYLQNGTLKIYEEFQHPFDKNDVSVLATDLAHFIANHRIS